MTREEQTISNLKKLKSFHNGSYGTAIDLAIKALEQQPCETIHGSTYGGVSWGGTYKPQQPCEDCISRDDAIELIAGADKTDGNEPVFSGKQIIKMLKSLPSVTPKARWIPVSERLPEKQDCYLVTTKWKGNYSGDVYIETNMAVYREKQKEWDCVDVIAWMPLPEPYKAESEDKT